MRMPQLVEVGGESSGREDPNKTSASSVELFGLPKPSEEEIMTVEPSADRYDSMHYRRCGRSGLKLPAVSLGLWHNFGGIAQ
jgi:hypothetical protein